jgi:hypothetical protein
MTAATLAGGCWVLEHIQDTPPAVFDARRGLGRR